MATTLTTTAKQACRDILGTALINEGFARFDDRTYLRRRGDVLDGVGVQFGRGAESFYLHYYTKLIADPVNDKVDAYRIGTRLQASEPGISDWVVSDGCDVDEVFRRISQTAIERALPYFDAVSTVRDYVIEVACDVNYRARLTNFDLAIALALLGRKNRVIQICEETLQVMGRAEALSEAERQRVAGHAVALRSAMTQGQSTVLLDEWSAAAIHKFGLDSALVE